MKVSDIYLNSVGVYLPEYVDARQAIAAGLYDEELRLESGIEGTYVSEDTPAVDMAVAAGRQALHRGTIDPAAIDYVMHAANYYQGPPGWTSTGYIMRELDLRDAASVQLGQACNGILAALEVAVGAITGAAGRQAALLTTGSNCSTPLVDRWRGCGPQNVLGDGGAAVTVTRQNGFAEVLSLNSATLPGSEGWLRGSASLLPPGPGEVSWLLDPVQRATEHTAATGESVQDWLDSANAQCRELCARSLAEAKIEAADLARGIGFHLARFAVEESIANLAGLPLDRTNFEHGRRIGHLGPADHLVSLDRMLRAGELVAGDHVMLISWGGGWNTSVAVLRIMHVPEWAVSEVDSSERK